MAINLRTVFAVTKAAIPHLTRQNGASIVNVSSIAGLLPDPGMPAYAAAKAAALSLTRSLALELGPANVRVNAICPAFSTPVPGSFWRRTFRRGRRRTPTRTPTRSF